MARMRPMDVRALIHTVEWSPKKILSDNTEVHQLDKVRINPGFVFFATGDQQSSYGNFKMYYDCERSTIDGKKETPKFAVGDTIKMIKGPINNYPTLLKIINVWQFYDIDGKHIHHVEILLR